MDELYAFISIFICILVFILLLLGIGSFYGGQWEAVSVGVAKFIMIVGGFAFGCYVLANLLGRRR